MKNVLPTPGMTVKANRKDGRIFAGSVDQVKYIGDRTLLVVKTSSGFKSLYLDDCKSCVFCDYANGYNSPNMLAYVKDYDSMMAMFN